MIRFLSGRKIAVIGHYTNLGQNIRERILDDSALKMFWLIDEKFAFGGRAAILPLLKAIATQNRRKVVASSVNDSCKQDCKTIRAVFVRSASLLLTSKKIKIN